MKKLIQAAKEAAAKAYVPYSNFQVGCAIEMKDGKIILGANIENASHGATSCAERSAIAVARMQDYKPEDIVKIAVYNNSEMIISPCGICRQVLKEMVPATTPVIMINGQDTTRESTVAQLLPFAFGKEFLDV